MHSPFVSQIASAAWRSMRTSSDGCARSKPLTYRLTTRACLRSAAMTDYGRLLERAHVKGVASPTRLNMIGGLLRRAA